NSLVSPTKLERHRQSTNHKGHERRISRGASSGADLPTLSQERERTGHSEPLFVFYLVCGHGGGLTKRDLARFRFLRRRFQPLADLRQCGASHGFANLDQLGCAVEGIVFETF